MRLGITVSLVFVLCLAAAWQTPAQTPTSAPPPASATDPAKPAGTPQKPAPAQPGQTTPPASSNAFPEDTSNVPVVNAKGMTEDRAEESKHLAAPMADYDPVRSPDDAAGADTDEVQGSSSSSSAGMDKLLPASGDDVPDKHRRLSVDAPTHTENVAEDVTVGDYYLDRKNWKAALSRFESAMVLAPDNPEVFWGLAESQRHLGNFAEARKNYQTVVDYDPDSKHGKEARKALKDPEIANAKTEAPQK